MENEISVYELIVIFEKARRDLLSKEFEFAHNGMTIRMVFGLNEISTLLEALYKAAEAERDLKGEDE